MGHHHRRWDPLDRQDLQDIDRCIGHPYRLVVMAIDRVSCSEGVQVTDQGHLDRQEFRDFLGMVDVLAVSLG
jgi:hypothetical protein